MPRPESSSLFPMCETCPEISQQTICNTLSYSISFFQWENWWVTTNCGKRIEKNTWLRGSRIKMLPFAISWNDCVLWIGKHRRSGPRKQSLMNSIILDTMVSRRKKENLLCLVQALLVAMRKRKFVYKNLTNRIAPVDRQYHCKYKNIYANTQVAWLPTSWTL